MGSPYLASKQAKTKKQAKMELPPSLNGNLPPIFNRIPPYHPSIALGPNNNFIQVPDLQVPPPLIMNQPLLGYPIVEGRTPSISREISTSLVVICDTNVYLHNMTDIWKILDIKRAFKLGIPWKVHNELDGLKKHADIKVARNARIAERKINYILSNLNHRVHCQDRFAYDQARDLFAIENGDDSILQAILQMENPKRVYLHTYDVILRNKALSQG